MPADAAFDFVSVLDDPTPCPYLPGRDWQMRYEITRGLSAAAYLPRLADGWRRFGPILFRPECPTCTMCQSIRVPVAGFRPSESQRRVWRKNIDVVTLQVGTPSISPERIELFARFHQHGHRTKGWPAESGIDYALLLANPFTTEEWCYYAGGRLIAVGYVDALPQALSAIYFFHDPDEKHRSLGTFNILSMLAAARERQLAHVYLGYYVPGYRSLEYKARFRPNEMLVADRGWQTPTA